MKQLSFPLAVVCFLFGFAVSCVEQPVEEDPGDKPNVEVPIDDNVYPEVRSFEVKAGESFSLSFETTLDWTASADVKWLVLSANSGAPGKVSIDCQVTLDQPNFGSETKANITVKAGGKDFVYPVTRMAVQREFSIVCEGREATSLVIDANEEQSSLTLAVEANFYWDLDRTVNWPVWIEKPGITDGKKGEDGIYRNTFTLNLFEAELDGNDKSGVLTFIDIDDESYKIEIPVSYVALVIPEVPFEIVCPMGRDMHVNKMGIFKDENGALTSTMMMLNFQVLTENADELIVITPTGVAHGEGAGFIQTETNHRFVIVSKTETPVEGGVDYMMIVTPGLLESTQPKSICDMSYILVLPRSVYEPYEKYFSANDPYYQMAFTWMRIDNYLFEYLYDADGNQVLDNYGNLVSVPKDFLKKYMLRVFVDAD